MISFFLNNQKTVFSGDIQLSLLKYLREEKGILSPKDGCSGQSFCGACMVEKDGQPALACSTPMRKVEGARIVTIEGFPEELKEKLARSFVEKGAVQCGFCTPGFLTRTKILLEQNSTPSRSEIVKALRSNVCRCTGYVKIFDAIESAARLIQGVVSPAVDPPSGKVGSRLDKYDAYNKALGTSPFVDDLRFDGMIHGALKFSDHPRANILKIDTAAAAALDGVIRILTANDIPGERISGVIIKDWPVMVAEGETTRYIGDVLVGVVAETEDIARKAVSLIDIQYEILEPLTDMTLAEHSPIKVHESGNLLETCVVKRGENIDKILADSAFVTTGQYETQKIEHAYLETEAAVALPWNDGGVEVFTQSQGIYEDQKQLAAILDLPLEKIQVNLVPNGGAFGGKEDMSVQAHAALMAILTNRPVKMKLNREESLAMHPKRHPIILDYAVGCDENGSLTGVKARIMGDTGAYASVGTKVLERAAGHATSGYHVSHVDLEAKTLYTNNIPSGAMRGFGANQATFAMECCVDDLCDQGGFDRWQFRWDNALVNGSMTSSGQVLHEGVGIRAALEAVKTEFYQAKFAGLATGIKNCGIGNGMSDFSEVKIKVLDDGTVELYHGWTEMGQGVFTVARQVLCTETGIDPEKIKVIVSTQHEARSEMTTASRGTSLVGNATIDAARELKEGLKTKSLEELVGRIYSGRWSFDQSTKPGAPGPVVTHYSYSYAAHLVVLDDDGNIDTVTAAHDAGKIINPTLFEGQIEGSVHMGLGYALSEELELENGQLKSKKMRDLGLLKIKDTPQIIVKGLEVTDPLGPYGAKGVGEIGLVPTAGAVANAFRQYDGIRRYKLPLKRNRKSQ
jgi:aldehyde oxidoreductase